MNFTNIKKDLFKKYNIDPNEITSSSSCPDEDKIALIYYLLEGYELARKNLLKGNLTASSYACGLVLGDNSVYFGLNFNHTRNEISSICAEREAILEAFNSKVQEFNPDINSKFSYEIKYILMSTYTKENKIWAGKITPCTDCLSWFNTGVNLSAQTKICSLKKGENGKIFLDIEPLDKFLPLRNLSYHIPNKEYTGAIKRSKSAQTNKIKDKELIKLYNSTFKEYKKNPFIKTSGQNIAAGAIINGEIFTGIKIDFSKRWFIEPLMAACYKGIEKYGEDATVEAVCFLGEEYTVTESKVKSKDGLVSIKTLGRINTKFAQNNTIVLTLDNEGLFAHTIEDYLPCEHKFIHTYEIK